MAMPVATRNYESPRCWMTHRFVNELKSEARITRISDKEIDVTITYLKAFEVLSRALLFLHEGMSRGELELLL